MSLLKVWMKPILFRILRAFLLQTNLKTGYTPPRTERTYRFALRFLLLPLVDISVAIIGNNASGLQYHSIFSIDVGLPPLFFVPPLNSIEEGIIT
jgi:hypothetical protein